GDHEGVTLAAESGVRDDLLHQRDNSPLTPLFFFADSTFPFRTDVMLRCGMMARPDECAWRTGCREAGFAHGNVPPARDSVQLHVVLGSRDRDPASRRADVGAARGSSRRAPHRP